VLWVRRVQTEVAALQIPHQQPLPFQVASDALTYPMHERLKLCGRRRTDRPEAKCVSSRDVHAVQEQQVEVDVEIQRTAEALDQGHGARLRPRVRQSGFPDQMRRDRPVDDAQHLAHDLRGARKQKPQCKRHTQHPLPHGLAGQHFIDQEGRFWPRLCENSRRLNRPPMHCEFGAPAFDTFALWDSQSKASHLRELRSKFSHSLSR